MEPQINIEKEFFTKMNLLIEQYKILLEKQTEKEFKNLSLVRN